MEVIAPGVNGDISVAQLCFDFAGIQAEFLGIHLNADTPDSASGFILLNIGL